MLDLNTGGRFAVGTYVDEARLTHVLVTLDRVVLSGPAFAEAGPLYLRAAQDAVSRLSFMRQVHPVVVELSQLGLQSAAIGAATVALEGACRPLLRAGHRPRLSRSSPAEPWRPRGPVW